MFRVSLFCSAILAAATLFSTPALAEPATQIVPPSPGTIEDLSLPVKLIADGPPRPLVRPLVGKATPIVPEKTVTTVASLTTAR
ncbi:MAG: hypothetical protein H7X89_16755 [Rhizobiales bacterium]|nr:hypothetical protein [Hyphomicrobiales bacterium]